MYKLFICAALIVGALCNANADSNVSVKYNTVKVVKGEATTFAVEIANNDEVTALQTNFTAIPENLAINGATAENSDSIKYSTTSNVDNTPVVVLYNLNNPTTSPSSTPLTNGKVYNVEVKADVAFTSGKMTLTTLASKTGGNAVTVAPITVDVMQNGDKNGDGKINLVDAVAIQEESLNGSYDYIADFNDDDKVNLVDAVAVQELSLAQAKKGYFTAE